LLQSRSRGRYRIGWRVVELSETLRGTVNVRNVALSVLQQLVNEYGETAHLAIMERGGVHVSSSTTSPIRPSTW
jgi:DNA-binding IclR family transcriptional regulator